MTSDLDIVGKYDMMNDVYNYERMGARYAKNWYL